MDIDLGQTLLVALGLLCVLPLVIFLVLAVIVYRAGQQRLDHWFSPNTEKLEQQLDRLRRRHPQATTEQLVNRLIHRQAVLSGIVGAITGLGGFWTLPIGLPVDLALSFQIQATLVNFIAYLYREQHPEGMDGRVRTYLIMTGSSRVTQTSTRFLMRLAVRVAGKSFAKFIPFAGALISFVVNYLIVQLMGRSAARWYASRA
jgi:uncharacterized membrane protein YbaN (DUF454 family)